MHLIKLASNVKLNDTFSTLEGRNTTDRFKRAHASTTLLGNTKYEVLHLNQGNPNHEHNLSNEWIESSPRTSEYWCMKRWTRARNVILQPRNPNVPCLSIPDRGRWLHLSALHSWGPTWNTALSSGAVKPPALEGSRLFRENLEGCKDDQRAKAPHLSRQPEKTGYLGQSREGFWEILYFSVGSFSVPKGGL